MAKLLSILFIFSIFVAALLLFGCTSTPSTQNSTTVTSSSNSPNTTVSQKVANIVISGFAFNPSSLEISPGITVIWTNNDGTTHTITSDTGSFNSGSIAPGQSWNKTFDAAGEYDYHCAIHSSMKGKIIVR